MQNISQLVGNYWIDLIEQFVPSTTIWGSTNVYRNTVFDTQKHQYKSNTLFLCEDPSPSFPFSAISSDCNAQVIKVNLNNNTPPTNDSTPFDSNNFFSCVQNNYCDCVWTMTNYCNSEFIGRVIGGDEFLTYCLENLVIDEVDLYARLTVAPDCAAYNQTWDATNRIFSQIIKITYTSLVPITEEYNYSILPYGNNANGITFNLTKLDTNTIRIDWNIPLSADEPIQTLCSNYYINKVVTPTQSTPIWDVEPIIVVTEPEFNCEVSRLFIYKGKEFA
jgi:hypothetical protein